MRWLVVLLVLPLASAEVVHEDPLGDQAAPHPALLKEFDIAEVAVSNVTRNEWGFDGVFVSVGYACPLTHSMQATNRTTHFTFTVGNETVRQGVWVATMDGCSSGQGTGIILGDECLITGIYVEAVWQRQDGVQVLDRAPDTGGLIFDACTEDGQDRQASNATGQENSDPAAAKTEDEGEAPVAERQAPAGAWLCLVAIAVAARRHF